MDTLCDEVYRRKLGHRGRGVHDLEQHVGPVLREIDARLGRRDVVRILELGPGYGTALLELRARYGARVELCGMNREPRDGNPEILLRNAADRGLPVDDRAPERALPAMAYGDVAAGLPFPDDAFDLVVSQVAWLYFGDKIGVLREVIRVLAPDGLAKIDADELAPKLPHEYARLVEIWQHGALVPFGDYLRRHGLAFVGAPDGEYLHVEKRPGFGDDLSLRCEIDTKRVHAHWDGIKCVYACEPGASRGGAASSSTDSTTPSATRASTCASS
ncbi:MAG TPA: class I SAM-dependent methyltransferase [Casimicrobiaceae bacterium]|nr:class I SAM-dependent methyltransferase [Casimicrobiaceae bacterium]